jgi:heat-inducible transcriptional repressor
VIGHRCREVIGVALDDRKLDVLRAIVEDFVSTHEPVGSKALVERHNLRVSPATVRNDMAVLEEEGYIAQPHTSAGRIPTDRGYRLFVDRLSSLKPLSAAEKRAIQQFLEGAVDLDDVVRRTTRLLTQLTRQVAVVQYPTLSRSVVRHLEVVELTPTRLLLVLITDAGRVEQRVVEVPEAVDEERLGLLRGRLGGAVHDRKLPEASAAVAELPEQVEPELRPVMTAVVTALVETLVEHPDDRIVLSGTANLAGLDFPSLRLVLEALEEQVVLLRLFGEVDSTSVVHVRIGGENEVENLRTTSIVTVGYGPGGTALGGVGVLGPTRMDYPGTMGAVRAVARYVGELLAGN